MSAEEIVRGLLAECEDCSEFGRADEECHAVLAYCPNRDAAALIKSLTAQLNGKTIELARLHEAIRVKGGTEHAPTEDAYLAVCTALEKCHTQLTASQQETRAAVEDMHRMHSLCMDVGGCCPECGDQIDTLMDAACNFCKKSGVNCWVETPGDESKCAAFEWRGPQTAKEESKP